MLDKVRKYQTKRDYVVEILREAIAAGEIKPGQRLRQEELAADLGISQTPVREALRKLEAEGLVSHVAHKGVKVFELSADDAEEMYRIGSVLEAQAASLAVERLSQDDSAGAIARLEKMANDMKALHVNKKLKELAELNVEFHLALYAQAHSPRLYRMISGLLSGFPREAFWIIPGEPERLTREHDEIIAAVKAGDADKAAQIVSDHRATSGKALVAYIKESEAPSRK
jgi:DNA-binding GntR family transcriptional regulator